MTRGFDALKVPHYVSASVAKSVYGIARATMDVDLAAALKMPRSALVAEALRRGYYVDGLMIAEAIERRPSFDLLHLETSAIKIDVFLPAEGDYQQSAMERRRAGHPRGTR